MKIEDIKFNGVRKVATYQGNLKYKWDVMAFLTQDPDTTLVIFAKIHGSDKILSTSKRPRARILRTSDLEFT